MLTIIKVICSYNLHNIRHIRGQIAFYNRMSNKQTAKTNPLYQSRSFMSFLEIPNSVVRVFANGVTKAVICVILSVALCI